VPVLIPRRWFLGLIGLFAVAPGCEPAVSDPLVIATSWPAADRRRIETEFAGWLEQHSEASPRGRVRIDWLNLARGDDLEKLAGRRLPPDVLLGGPTPSYERLARAKRLSALPINGSPDWAVIRRAAIRPVTASSEGHESAAAADHRGVAFADPRNDPISLAWAQAQLARGGFREGYARLVEVAGYRPRIERQVGSVSASIDGEEAGLAARVIPSDRSPPGAASIAWTEGVAIVRAARHPDQALAFLKFLAATDRAGSMLTREERATADDHDLLADLLGATLVDAQDELWAAWAALQRAGLPPSQLRWMTEPPPWPPASIAKILTGQGEQSMTMVETLAGQLAPDPAARAWLISSLLSPPRLIDSQVLDELTRAADGCLFREPRFREWLRAEWTAWARQRYRRVLRVVASGRGPISPTSSSIPSSLTTDH
jgi:hypothetical protein